MRIATNMASEQERKIKAHVTMKDGNGGDGDSSGDDVNFVGLLNHRCLISWSGGHIWNIKIMFRHSCK